MLDSEEYFLILQCIVDVWLLFQRIKSLKNSDFTESKLFFLACKHEIYILDMKSYFKYFDVFKFASCLLIVTYHLQSSSTGDLVYWWRHVRDISMPMFVVFSSLLFWRRIRWDEHSSSQLKHYVKRLLSLMLGWSVVLLPFWLHNFMTRHPDNWAVYLVPKLLLYGGCRGSYFIMSLIYGTALLYLLHRYLGKVVPFVLVFIVGTYFDLVHQDIITDFVGVRVNRGVLDTNFLCFRLLFYMEVCVWFIPWLAGKLSKLNSLLWIGVLLVVFVALCAVRSDLVAYVAILCFVIILGALLYNVRCTELPSWSVTLRNMSIVVYLLHFVVSEYGKLALRRFAGIDLAAYGPYVEYSVILAVTLPIAYLVAKPLTQRFPLVKRWLL